MTHGKAVSMSHRETQEMPSNATDQLSALRDQPKPEKQFITSMTWQILFSWGPKSLQTVTAAMKFIDPCSLEEKL